MIAPPKISAIVVQWGSITNLEGLLERWPFDDDRFELVVVDNQARQCQEVQKLAHNPRFDFAYIAAEHNMGFAGGVNRGLEHASGDILLLLNPDAHPEAGALDALLRAFAAHPECSGVAPGLLGDDGQDQCRWQLRPLPTVTDLVLQALFLDRVRGPETPPGPGTEIEQPAAAALAFRRDALERLEGMDERFYPAWFEDVDLCRRARLDPTVGPLIYWPAARFTHGLGSSVPSLGYGTFLFLYYRNLAHYLEKHHGRAAAIEARFLLALASLARIAVLPFRRPRRAPSRFSAFTGLLNLSLAALTGWRRPRKIALRFTPPQVELS